jgi:nucleotide-binding universal stress UspA family protein
MERKIIVAYDGSEDALDALVLGNLLAELTAHPILLAAFSDARPMRTVHVDGDLVLHAGADARDVLTNAPAGPEIERRVVHGRSPASALSMLAEAQDSVAIVVGSGGDNHGGATGAIARQLFGNSPCAVAIAPCRYRERAPRRLAQLLAAYVDTPEGLDALRIAAQLAHAARASLRVVSIVDSPHATAAREQALEAELRRLANTVAVDGLVLLGDPVTCLLEEADSSVDLIVTGSRGFGVVRQVALGSVSSQLVERSPVPVLVVPRGGDRDLVSSFPASRGAAN